MRLAEATQEKGLAEAEAQRALNDAYQQCSDEQTSPKFKPGPARSPCQQSLRIPLSQ